MSPDKSRNPGHQFVCNVTFSPSLCGQQMSHQCVSPERGLTIQSDSDTYDTLKLVGEGIYGEVTKCRKRSTGRFVALKALKHICCGSTEIRILKLLGKTDADEFHIVRLLEYFHVNARPHLVFELLDQSLLDFHKATDFAPLPVKHIRVIATQLLKALVKLKELSIIHTDLKPDNIMLVNHVQFPFRVKLIDFGSASVLTEVQHIQEPYIQARYYRSPEILLGLPFCEKMDMWSLGCVLSELRLGRPLYPGRNQYEQIMYIVQTQGLPKDYLLDQASRSHLFFTRHWRPFTAHQWELKSPREYPSHASVPPLETGRPTLKSLDQMEALSITHALLLDDEERAEYHDCSNMVQLLKRMLSLDPKTRIAPTAALRHQFISLQQLQANHDRTEYYRLSIQGLSAALMYNRAERDEDNQHMLECSHHTSTLDNKSKQTQGNCSRASEHRATDQKDHLAIKHSGRAMSLNMTIGGANLVQNKPFTSHAKNPKHLTHSYQGDCQHISWCVQRNFTESVQGGLTCQPREDQYKVPPQRREDVSFEEVTTLEQEADQGIDIKKDINTNKFSIAVYSLKRSREIQDRETNEATCSKGQATLQPDGASQEHTSPKRSELPTRRRGSRKPSTTKPEVAASRSKPAPVDSFSVAPKPPESKMAIFVHRHGEPGLQLAKQQVLVCAGQCKSPHRELTSMIGDHNKHFFVGSQPGI
eukprot:gi/632944970/ref/XP_007887792.1/ PREDICTED: homeodomain-interacting protein kinase 4-like [Callorhinchus milii]